MWIVSIVTLTKWVWLSMFPHTHTHTQVVCRYLKFESAVEALSNGYFGEGDADQPIWLDDVDCFGSENILTSCLTSHFGVHNCRHSEDAGVRCYSELRNT